MLSSHCKTEFLTKFLPPAAPTSLEYAGNTDEKFQTRSREPIGAVIKRESFGRSFGRIGVVLSQHLVCLRTK